MGYDQPTAVMEQITTSDAVSEGRRNDGESVLSREGTQEIAFHNVLDEVDSTLIASEPIERLADFLPRLPSSL